MTEGPVTADGRQDLVVDLDSPVPPFEQIRAAVAGLVASGGLAAGVRLPSVRQLAADLGIAPGTVQRAYSELRVAGVVSTATRRGVVVIGRAAEAPHPSPPAPLRRTGHADAARATGDAADEPVALRLAAAAARFVQEARFAGAADAAVRHALEAALAG